MKEIVGPMLPQEAIKLRRIISLFTNPPPLIQALFVSARYLPQTPQERFIFDSFFHEIK